MATLGLVVASIIGGPIGRMLIEGRCSTRRTRRGEQRRPVRHRAAAAGDHPQRADAHAAHHLHLRDHRLPAAAGHPRLRGHAAALCHLPLGRLRRRQPDGRGAVRHLGLHSPALSLVSEFASGSSSPSRRLRSQLWALAGMAGTLLAVLPVQVAIAIAAARLLAFRLLGEDYQAAVLTAGYASFVIGASTAIATMTAVTKRDGPFLPRPPSSCCRWSPPSSSTSPTPSSPRASWTPGHRCSRETFGRVR